MKLILINLKVGINSPEKKQDSFHFLKPETFGATILRGFSVAHRLL